MAFDQAAATILIGLSYLMFSFAEKLQGEEWLQGIKLLFNSMGLFVMLSTSGFLIKMLETSTADVSLLNISNIIYYIMLFTIIPTIVLFLVIFIKELLFFWESLRGKPKF